MDNNPFDFSAWAGRENVHPIALVAIIVLGLSMLALPRRWAVLPMAIMASFISPAQRIIVFTLNFDLLRIMVVIGWARLMVRGEARGLTLKPIDIVLVLWAISATTIFSLRDPDPRTFIYMLGVSFDCIGMYFLFRFLIRDWEDIRRAALSFAIVAAPVAVAFINEHMTGRNVFAIFGFVPEITKERDGRLRCQGAFAHPILAGCFWATQIPLMAACLMKKGNERILLMFGMLASSIIVIMCASSTPVMAILCGVLGGALFFVRDSLRWIRWSLVIMLVGMQLVMQSPVWHLLARVDIVSGSTGWYRYHLIDEAIKHFDEWWLLGTNSTNHWNDAIDITNQYVLDGINGGLLSMLLFIALIVFGYRGIGAAMRDPKYSVSQKILVWALGVSLFQHTMNFFAVSYFQQIIMIWYLLLAMISTVTPPSKFTITASRRIPGRAAPHADRENIELRFFRQSMCAEDDYPRFGQTR